MPYPNEHAARIAEPKGFDRIARTNHAFGEGVHALYGIKGDTSKLISIHFDRWVFTAEEALQWLADHDYKPTKWEPAAEQKFAEDGQTAIGFSDGDGMLFADEKGNSDWVHLFRSGKYPQGDIDERAVGDMAVNYDEGLLAAPIGVDHKPDGPAFGWVSRLKAVGGKLYARFRDIVPEFREVAAAAFPRRSIEAYPPEHKSNPTPGHWYLKGVSFLGIKAPAVKGLDPLPASFSGAEGVAFNYEEWSPMPQTNAPDQATQLAAKDAEIVKLQAQLKEAAAAADKPRVAKLEEALAEQKTANAALAQQIVAERRARQLTEARAWAEKLSADGKLVPALAAGLPEMIVRLGEMPQEGDQAVVVAFSEKDAEGKPAEAKLTPAAWLKRFCEHLPKLVELAEVAGDDPTKPKSKAKKFGVPRGAVIEDEELAAKATAYQEEQETAGKKVSFADALLEVARV